MFCLITTREIDEAGETVAAGDTILEVLTAFNIFVRDGNPRGFAFHHHGDKPREETRKVISEAYELEYGQDCLEVHVGAVQPGERALVIDDLVATGGTLSATIKLLEHVGAEVVECACVIGLAEVKGQCWLNGKPFYTLVEPREIDNCYQGRPPLLLCYHIKIQ
ncbi:hypothetical protein UlMin_009000 [Ulmus minor]